MVAITRDGEVAAECPGVRQVEPVEYHACAPYVVVGARGAMVRDRDHTAAGRHAEARELRAPRVSALLERPRDASIGGSTRERGEGKRHQRNGDQRPRH